MQIFDRGQLEQAVEMLERGGVLVLPSETSYGLSCDAFCDEAVGRVFDIKKRDKKKSVLVVVADVEMAKEYLVWNEDIQQLADKHWPGALTIVGKCTEKAKKELAPETISSSDTLALRVTIHPVLFEFSSCIARPLVSTSANVAGESEIYDPDEIVNIYLNQTKQPDAILNFGVLSPQKPTTIVSVLDNEIKVLRQGEIVL